MLTPLSKGSLIATTHADPRSIMCDQIPGSITKNGKPIIGGTDIVASDYEFVSQIYPVPKKPGGTTTRPKRARR